MKNELRAILDKYDGQLATMSAGHSLFADVNIFCDSLPDGSAQGGVSIADFKYAKMQTVHQLLVNTVVRPTKTDEHAVELARLVDAAYGAIDGPQQDVKPSLMSDNAGDFSEALIWLKEGKKVSLPGWHTGVYLVLNGGNSAIELRTGNSLLDGAWVPADGELLSERWFVVP